MQASCGMINVNQKQVIYKYVPRQQKYATMNALLLVTMNSCVWQNQSNMQSGNSGTSTV